MSDRVTLDRTSDGRLVAIKRSNGGGDDERLRREALVLERAQHPGVVELVDLIEGDRGLELRTMAVGDGALVGRHLSVPRVAALATSVAATLADLHALGIVHARIEASHVLLGPGGRPLLTGFAESSLPEDEPAEPQRPGDGAAGSSGGARRTAAGDVGGLGRVVLDLLSSDLEAEPIPDLRRRLRRRGRPQWTGYQQRALLTLADQACADDPAHRPTARAFAAALSAAFPDPLPDEVHPERETVADAPLGANPTDTEPPIASTEGAREGEEQQEGATASAPRDRPRPVLVGSAAAIVGVVGLATIGLGASTVRGSEQPEVVPQPVAPSPSDGGGAEDAGPSAAPGEPTSTPSPRPSGTTSAASGSTTSAPSAVRDCPDADGPVADVDGDGCLEPVQVDGTIVTTDGGRFQLGEDGDQVTVGDWDCDGASTPAVLRPSTGDVFAFERWAPADGELSATSIDTVAGGTRLEVEREGRCDRLVVVGPSGSTQVAVEDQR